MNLRGNICSILKRNADQSPLSPALIDSSNGSITAYQELWLRVNQAAYGLKSIGVNHGDRVAIYLPNGPEFIICFFAILKLGAVVVPLNILSKSYEIEYILKNAAAKAVVGWEPELHENLMPVRATLEVMPTVVGAGDAKLNACDLRLDDWFKVNQVTPMARVGDHHPAAILYTSGTTGRPKGAVLSQKNLAENAKINAQLLGINDLDRALSSSPFSHVYFVQSVLGPLFAGASVITLLRSSPDLALAAIQKYRATHFSGVPTMFRYMLQRFHERTYDVSSWRVAGSAAAGIAPEMIAEIVKTFDVDFLEAYGSTETSSTVTFTRLRHPRPGSIGLPAPGYQVKLLDESNREVGAGEVGELVVQGPGVFQGYWGMPESNQEVFTEEGWFRSGDLARQDHDGYLYLVDRKQDMMVSGGYNIYPRELEEVLLSHPDVLESAVLGKPDLNLGEIPVAYVILRWGSDLTVDEIMAFCQKRMAKYKVPRAIEIVQDFPRTASGKILKRELKTNSSFG